MRFMEKNPLLHTVSIENPLLLKSSLLIYAVKLSHLQIKIQYDSLIRACAILRNQMAIGVRLFRIGTCCIELPPDEPRTECGTPDSPKQDRQRDEAASTGHIRPLSNVWTSSWASLPSYSVAARHASPDGAHHASQMCQRESEKNGEELRSRDEEDRRQECEMRYNLCPRESIQVLEEFEASLYGLPVFFPTAAMSDEEVSGTDSGIRRGP